MRMPERVTRVAMLLTYKQTIKLNEQSVDMMRWELALQALIKFAPYFFLVKWQLYDSIRK